MLREPILEPYKLYKKFTGKKSEDKIKQEAFSGSQGKEWLAVWIRGNFFIPDARKYWVKRSVKRLSSFLRENHVDAIISNGTPHSCHLIGMKLKRKFNIPWLADFRDPWTKVDYFDDLKLTSLARRKHYRLEYNVLENADVVTTVSKTWEQDFVQLGAKKPQPLRMVLIEVIFPTCIIRIQINLSSPTLEHYQNSVFMKSFGMEFLKR